MNIKLFLDDIRNPKDYGLDDVIWVKTCDEAIEYLKCGYVEWISFDHDLGEEKTGYDVAKYIEEQVNYGYISCPKYQIHSANPVGRENIKQAMENTKKLDLNN